MFKLPLFKMIGSAALALTIAVGMAAPVALAAGQTAATCAAPTGLNAKTTETGLIITDVAKGSPAATAGLSANQILVSVNGKAISQQADLDTLVAGSKAGDKLTLEVASQGGMIQQKSVTLGTNADKPFLGVTAGQVAIDMGPFTYVEPAGANCPNQPFELPSNVASGLFVTSVDQNSASGKAGLVMDDVILSVNSKPAGTPDNLTKTISALKSGAVADLSVYNPLTKQTSDIKVTMADKPDLGAQVAVIVESATTAVVPTTTTTTTSAGNYSSNSQYGNSDVVYRNPVMVRRIDRIAEMFNINPAKLNWYLSHFHIINNMSATSAPVLATMTTTKSSGHINLRSQYDNGDVVTRNPVMVRRVDRLAKMLHINPNQLSWYLNHFNILGGNY